MKKLTLRLCALLSAVLLSIMALLAGALIVPALLGYREMAVLSGSMEPTVPVGSIVYVRPLPGEKLAPGDICTYCMADGETFVTHRVVSLDRQKQTLITKGDANNTADGEIAFANVYGKAMFHLPWLGLLVMGVRTPRGILAVTGLLAAIFLLNLIPAWLEAGPQASASSQ